MKKTLLVLGLLFAVVASAAETPAQPLLIENAWIKEAPPVAKVHAGYMRITNQTDKTLEITGVTALHYRMAMIHRTVERGGMMSMEHIDILSVAPHSTVVLEPGGMHLMLMTPDRVFKADDVVTITLEMNNGQSQSLDVSVKAAP